VSVFYCFEITIPLLKLTILWLGWIQTVIKVNLTS